MIVKQYLMDIVYIISRYISSTWYLTQATANLITIYFIHSL